MTLVFMAVCLLVLTGVKRYSLGLSCHDIRYCDTLWHDPELEMKYFSIYSLQGHSKEYSHLAMYKGK